MHNKKTIRAALLRQRKALLLSEQISASQAIIRHITALPIYQSAHTIALYHAFQGEVNVDTLWALACQAGKKTTFPVIHPDSSDNSMIFLAESPNDLHIINHYHIQEPQHNAPMIPIQTIDCIFLPVVAFDQQGYRLGMGRGYYDRALTGLAKNHPVRIGVAYDFQQVLELPHDPWDMPLDIIITESGILFHAD